MRLILSVIVCLICLAGSAAIASAPGPLSVHQGNPRYFTADGETAILLTGSHTWLDFQDAGGSYPPPVLSYDCFLRFLATHNHNFFRLWRWEQSAYTAETAGDYFFDPMPHQRTGPGTAIDGRPKFDLDQFNDAYFDRMRERVVEADKHGIYVAIVLFNGWSIQTKGGLTLNNPWKGHPYNPANNINGIDGDPGNNNLGEEVHTLAVPAVTAYQEAYVQRVIDEVNDLDNVLYEISNESHGTSEAWQYHMIDFIKSYEATLPKQHPVGMSVEWPNGSNSDLFASNADWIAPNGSLEPSIASGAKVIIADTDHLCGVCGDRSWVWKSFTRGENPAYMDPYDAEGYGVGALPQHDPVASQFRGARMAMGMVRMYADRMDLANCEPVNFLSSPTYCLANTNNEYLVYAPSGGQITINLGSATGDFNVEWLEAATGQTYDVGTVSGGASRALTPPFSGEAVVYIYR